MLRVVVGVLVAANLIFLAFTLGSFDGLFGLSAQGDREPERLTRQVRPETIRILPSSPQASGATPATACLETGPVAEADAATAQAVLSSVLAPGSWTDTRSEAGSGPARTAIHVYRVPAADPATATRLLAVALAPGGRYPFTACPAAGR